MPREESQIEALIGEWLGLGLLPPPRQLGQPSARAWVRDVDYAPGGRARAEKELSRALKADAEAAAEMEPRGSRMLVSAAHSAYPGECRSRVCVVATNLPLGGVGVDLEHTRRPLKGGLLERITRPAERKLNLGALELWTLKEACFKADPQNEGRTLTQYEILRWDLARNEGRARLAVEWGSREFGCLLLRDGEWLVALAVFQKT